MAGRRPTPTALKLVTGNAGKRAINTSEPRPSTTKGPVMPSYLSPKAKAAWKKLTKLLKDMGVLTAADGFALERLCDVYAEILELRDEIAKNGRTYESIRQLDDIADQQDGLDDNDSGLGLEQRLIKPNPAVAMLADADRRFKSYLVEFGLTPAARTKIQVTNNDKGKKKADPLATYFG